MMRKFILGVAAVAALALPSVASADVPRCEASVPVNTTVRTATFTWTEPANVEHQFENVWTHSYTVIVNPDNTFDGTGVQDGTDGNGTQHYTELVSGSFSGSPLGSTVSFVTQRNDGVSHSVVNAPANGSLVIGSATGPNNSFQVSIDMRIAMPVITTTVTTTVGTESVKNHGQYVKALGGGKVPAQACAGMPLNSTQGVS
jgi:hypothetical protein